MSLCVSLISERRIFFPSSFLSKGLVIVLFFFPEIFFPQLIEDNDMPLHTESSQQKYSIENIIISGNNKTKEKIILRELNFKVGDLVTVRELEAMQVRSQQNLINTSLFVFVTIGHDILDEKISIHINVKERWYVWPSPIFEVQDRNFNSWWRTKDIFRINYGAYLTFENMFGLNQSLTLKLRKGYTENYGFSYKIPYINKKQTIGMNASYLYSRNNEIAYDTYGNQLKFYRNTRNYVRREQEAKIGFTLRNGLYTRHTFEAAFHASRVSDTITRINPEYFGKNNNSLQYFSLNYNFRYDLRDNKIYPLKGYIYFAALSKDGLGLLKKENVDNFSANFGVSRYWNFLPRVFWANHIRVRYSLNRTPYYYFNRALGWGNDLVRGYEYYVVDGQSYGMFKTNVRYQLVKPRIYNASWAKRFDKFNKIPYSIYVGVYGDGAWVQDKSNYANNPLSNSFLYGGGVGIDFVTYYDSVFRIECSVNQMRQTGIYLHLSAPF